MRGNGPKKIVLSARAGQSFGFGPSHKAAVQLLTQNMASTPPPPTAPDALESLDADPDVDMVEPPLDPLSSENLPAADGTEEPEKNGEDETLAAEEPRVPVRKDVSLREFLSRMDEYAPIVCEWVSNLRGISDADLPRSQMRSLSRL